MTCLAPNPQSCKAFTERLLRTIWCGEFPFNEDAAAPSGLVHELLNFSLISGPFVFGQGRGERHDHRFDLVQAAWQGITLGLCGGGERFDSEGIGDDRLGAANSGAILRRRVEWVGCWETGSGQIVNDSESRQRAHFSRVCNRSSGRHARRRDMRGTMFG
jgi:hypothetical protein